MKALSRVVGVVFFVLAAGAIVARLFFIDYSVVPQNGMYPGLPSGSYLFGWKRPYGSVLDVQRGDVGFFTRTEGQASYRFVWRVIGLPGETVEVNGEAVTINGQPLGRDVVRQEAGMVIYLERNGKSSYEVAYPRNQNAVEPPPVSLTVPENHLFVLGDNRYDARDSRYSGPIPFNSIVARKIPRD